MGECLITRRGGEAYELPILDETYPKDVTFTVIKGNTVSATFEALITTPGKPAEYTYQWYVDGTAVEGANGISYTMSGLANTVTKSVYCAITNKGGTVTTRVATLQVTQHYTPVLNTSYPANATVTYRYGKTTSATFKVQIATAGYPASYTYQWYVDDKAVSGATSDTYTISGLNADATKTVYCKVTNAAGTVTSRKATLKVSLYKLYLYNKGDKCESVHGGWTTSVRWHATNAKTPVITYNTNSMTLGVYGNGYNFQSGIMETVNGVNLTDYSILRFVVTNLTASQAFDGSWVRVIPGATSNLTGNVTANVEKSITAKGTYDLNIASLSGTHDIITKIVCAGGNGSYTTAEFSEIYLM